MLSYNVDYAINGTIFRIKIRAFSPASARMKVQSENPGCNVLSVLGSPFPPIRGKR